MEDAWTNHINNSMQATPVSHVLWQKGNRVTCTQCGITLHLDGQQRLIHTAAVKKPCKSSGSQTSTPLTELFRRQTEQASQEASRSSHAPGSSTPPEEHEAEQVKRPRLGTTNTRHLDETSDTGPTPRRLHFQTDFDARTQATATVPTALAMSPSPWADAKERNGLTGLHDKGPTKRSPPQAAHSDEGNQQGSEPESTPAQSSAPSEDDQPGETIAVTYF